MGRDPLAEMPGCGHVGRLAQAELLCPKDPELEVSSWGQRGKEGVLQSQRTFYKTLGGGPSSVPLPHPRAFSAPP